MVEIWLKSYKIPFSTYLNHFSSDLDVFGLVLKGKPAGLTGKGIAGKGRGQIFLPGGYPGYSLVILNKWVCGSIPTP